MNDQHDHEDPNRCSVCARLLKQCREEIGALKAYPADSSIAQAVRQHAEAQP